MKVRDLIIQLLSMPMSADVELHLDEEYCAFTVEHATAGDPPDVNHLVALNPVPVPEHLAPIVEKYRLMEEAAPDMLAALEGISRNAAVDDAWLEPVHAAIAKATGKEVSQ